MKEGTVKMLFIIILVLGMIEFTNLVDTNGHGEPFVICQHRATCDKELIKYNATKSPDYCQYKDKDTCDKGLSSKDNPNIPQTNAGTKEQGSFDFRMSPCPEKNIDEQSMDVSTYSPSAFNIEITYKNSWFCYKNAVNLPLVFKDANTAVIASISLNDIRDSKPKNLVENIVAAWYLGEGEIPDSFDERINFYNNTLRYNVINSTSNSTEYKIEARSSDSTNSAEGLDSTYANIIEKGIIIGKNIYIQILHSGSDKLFEAFKESGQVDIKPK
jgi:hypothetical protein